MINNFFSLNKTFIFLVWLFTWHAMAADKLETSNINFIEKHTQSVVQRSALKIGSIGHFYLYDEKNKTLHVYVMLPVKIDEKPQNQLQALQDNLQRQLNRKLDQQKKRNNPLKLPFSKIKVLLTSEFRLLDVFPPTIFDEFENNFLQLENHVKTNMTDRREDRIIRMVKIFTNKYLYPIISDRLVKDDLTYNECLIEIQNIALNIANKIQVSRRQFSDIAKESSRLFININNFHDNADDLNDLTTVSHEIMILEFLKSYEQKIYKWRQDADVSLKEAHHYLAALREIKKFINNIKYKPILSFAMADLEHSLSLLITDFAGILKNEYLPNTMQDILDKIISYKVVKESRLLSWQRNRDEKENQSTHKHAPPKKIVPMQPHDEPTADNILILPSVSVAEHHDVTREAQKEAENKLQKIQEREDKKKNRPNAKLSIRETTGNLDYALPNFAFFNIESHGKSANIAACEVNNRKNLYITSYWPDLNNLKIDQTYLDKFFAKIARGKVLPRDSQKQEGIKIYPSFAAVKIKSSPDRLIMLPNKIANGESVLLSPYAIVSHTDYEKKWLPLMDKELNLEDNLPKIVIRMAK